MRRAGLRGNGRAPAGDAVESGGGEVVPLARVQAFMIEIIVNGEAHRVEPGQTAADLVARLALGNRRIAMEVNETLLPRSRYADYRLAQGDRIEIVHAIGGG